MANSSESEKLIIANQKLVLQTKEKDKLLAQLVIANNELAMNQKQKEKTAEELIFAKKELIFQNEENKKQSTELTTVYQELKKSQEKGIKGKQLYSFISCINQTISRVKDEQTLFDEVCRIAVKIGKFKMAWIGIADISRRKIQLVASNGATEEDIKLLSDKTYHAEGLTDRILHGSEYYAVPNIQAEDIIRWQDYAAARGFISAVSLPIKKSGKVIGTFDMYSSEMNLFNDEEIKMLREVAEDISFGVDLFEKEKIHHDTEMRVLENVKRFRALIEHGIDMKTLTTREGKALYCSPSVEKSLGYSLEEFLNIYPLGLIHPDAIESYLQKRNAILKTPGKSFEFKQQRLHKNGNWIWCEGVVTNLLDEDGIYALVSNFRDITERNVAEEHLRKSEVFNRGVLNSLSAHIAVVDNVGKIVAVNEVWEQFATENGETTLERTGVGSNYFEACKKSVEIGDEYASDAMNGMMDVLQGKQNDFYLEYPCHSPNQHRWFGMRVKRFESDEARVVVAHLNITERKLAENKLIVTSNELQSALNDLTKIMDSSLDVICAVDAKGNFLKVSAASEAVWAYEPKELIGKSVFDFIYPEDHEKTRNMAINVMEGNSSTNFENRYVRKDGTVVPMSWSVRWDVKDKIRYGIARDVTERKRVEEQIKISELRFREFFESAPEALVVIDVSTLRFMKFNENAVKLLKYPPEKLLKMDPAEISPEFQVDEQTSQEKAMKMTMDVLKGDKPVLEWLIKDANGKNIMCELRLVLLSSIGDRNILASFVDISERKKAEKLLENQHEELQKTNAELDRFVYSTSHDLRAPLASMLGLIDIMTDEIEPGNMLLMEYTGMMKQSVLKLDNFIEDILAYSRNARTELGKDEIVFETIIQEACAEYKYSNEPNGFKLEVDIKQTAKFSSDKRRIKVVLNNLISNAVKYKDDTKEKSFVHISVQSDQKKATIIIEDNGIGIAEKEMAKIFEMFYRASAQSTGSGLGLYIVKETIDKLGATITLESEKSVGSKFTIIIFNLFNNENKNNTTD